MGDASFSREARRPCFCFSNIHNIILYYIPSDTYCAYHSVPGTILYEINLVHLYEPIWRTLPHLPTFFLPTAAASHHIPISPAAVAAPNTDTPTASSRRPSLSFLGHAKPPLAALIAATQPLPPLLYSNRTQPLPSPHLPSSSPRQCTSLIVAAFLSSSTTTASSRSTLPPLLSPLPQPLPAGHTPTIAAAAHWRTTLIASRCLLLSAADRHCPQPLHRSSAATPLAYHRCPLPSLPNHLLRHPPLQQSLPHLPPVTPALRRHLQHCTAAHSFPIGAQQRGLCRSPPCCHPLSPILLC
ncbi:hypothetical protein BHM03_00029149 [Ensete ventricosum]|nr:hypothetical protein BHM03_00029149 [Ensete ventricosum]